MTNNYKELLQEDFNRHLEEVSDMALDVIKRNGDVVKFREKVNKFIEYAGGNKSEFATPQSLREKRKLVAYAILVRCVSPLSREQLKRLEDLLNDIAERDLPPPRKAHSYLRKKNYNPFDKYNTLPCKEP